MQLFSLINMVCLPALHIASSRFFSSFFRSISAHAFWPISSFVLLLINSHTHTNTHSNPQGIPVNLFLNSSGTQKWFSNWLFQCPVFVCDSHYHHKRHNLADLHHKHMDKIRQPIRKHIHMQTHTHTHQRGFSSEFLLVNLVENSLAELRRNANTRAAVMRLRIRCD